MTARVCFHGIGKPHRSVPLEEEPYWVSEKWFRELLDRLAGLPDVELSFDDGNASDIDVALPALLARGLSGRFYVLAGRLRHGGSLHAEDLGALQAAGMTIGSHGMDHVPWRRLRPDVLRRELSDARKVLEDVTGRSVTEIALPFGQYDRRTLRGLRARGYSSVRSSDRYRSGDTWLRPRWSVRSADRVEDVLAFVAGPGLGAEMVARAKSVVKRLR